MKTPKYYWMTKYTVRGRGYFPFDMLRYDLSWPAEQEDIQWMNQREERELMLVAYRDGRTLKFEPTRERWKSWLLVVTEVYPRERVVFEDVPKIRRLPLHGGYGGQQIIEVCEDREADL